MNNANGGNIIFHFKGDTTDLKKATSNIGSMTKSLLVATGITKAFSMGMNLITSSTGSAIERLDQLNAFPRVMSSLGVSTEKSQKAIDRLSEGLKGLPTTLNAGTTAVSRFVAKNGDVEKSTEMFLALNDAIISGNAPMENQQSALEQMIQAYSKGKPDIIEWRTLMTAMPGQIKQVAKAMGYVNTDDLYEALQKGTVSMDEFLNTIVKLDTEGIDGLQSFQEQSRNATGGIGTSITNMKTAVARGLAGVVNSIDKGLKDANVEGGISGIISNIGKGLETGLNEVSKRIQPLISGILTGKISVKDATKDLSTDLFKAIEKAIKEVGENLPEVLSTGVDILGGIAQSFEENFPAIAEALAGVVDKIVEFLGNPETQNKIAEAGTSLLKGLVDGILAFLEKEGIGGIYNILNTIGNAPFQIGQKIIVGLATGILESIGLPTEAMETIKNVILDFIDDPLGFLLDIGGKIIQGLIDGISGALGFVTLAMSSVSDMIGSFISDPLTFLFDIGSQIIQGLIDGISSMVGSVWNTVSEVAGTIIDGFCDFFGIHSPSTEMRWMGNMMDEGYIKGIEEMKGEISKTMTNTFELSPQLANSSSLNYSPNVMVNNYITNETDPLGQTVTQIKTFANGSKNDYNYGMGV